MGEHETQKRSEELHWRLPLQGQLDVLQGSQERQELGLQGQECLRVVQPSCEHIRSAWLDVDFCPNLHHHMCDLCVRWRKATHLVREAVREQVVFAVLVVLEKL